LTTTAASADIIKVASTLASGSVVTIGADEITATVDVTVVKGTILKADSILMADSVVSSDKIEVTIRNSGSVDCTITTIYVKTPEGDTWSQTWDAENVITTSASRKFTFTILHTVDGSDGAVVAAASGVPFGWKATGTYTIKAVTDNGFTAEAPYTSPSAHE